MSPIELTLGIILVVCAVFLVVAVLLQSSNEQGIGVIAGAGSSFLGKDRSNRLVFFWLFWKTLGLAFRAAWGMTKILASLLFVLAVPLLIGCLLFAGGLLLLVPVAMVVLAAGLLKAIC